MEELKNYIENLNKEFVEIVGGSFCRVDTGEIFTNSEVNKYISIKIEDYKVKHNAELNKLAKDYGYEINQRLISNKTNIKTKNKKIKQRYDGGDFNIVYRKELEYKMSLKLKLVEKGVYSWICDLIAYPSNCVLINDEIPTMETLSNIIGIKSRSLREHLNTLEEKGLIKTIRIGNKRAIYVNPKYYASGKDLEMNTLKMFDLIDCDEEKVKEYLD